MPLTLLLSLALVAHAEQTAYPNDLAQVPPMGWNSWNCFGKSITAERILEQAEALAASELRELGFVHLVIDDGWQGERGGDFNALQGNDDFPDVGALSREVRALGLRLGIYSTPWETSYQGLEGSADHEALDAWQWAAWGIGYLKYDWNPVDVAAATRMRDALAVTGHPVVYSLSNNVETALAPTWAEVSNLWRTTHDITDSWESMSGIGFSQDGLEVYAGPGSWNDPDMMVLGYVGWGEEQHPTELTADEQKTHVSLWSLLAAPLMLGCDLTRLDEDTLALLTNTDVLAVNQDPAGVQGYRVEAGENPAGAEVWAKPLYDGTWAVGLFNQGEAAAEVQVRWTALELPEDQDVEDLWTGDTWASLAEGIGLEVPAHGVRLLRVGTATPIAPQLLPPLEDTTEVEEEYGLTLLAAGSRPFTWTVENLPAGLAADGPLVQGTPEEAGTFDIAVTATNEGGSTTGTFTLTVEEDPGEEDPRIHAFWAEDLTVPPGQPTTLHWRTEHAETLSLETDAGDTVADPGEESVEVAPGQTTTYTLQAEGSGTTASHAITLTVPQESVRLGLDCPGRLRPTNDTEEWQGWGSAGEDVSIDDNALSVGGEGARWGLGVHVDSTLVYPLEGHYGRFEARVGVDDEVSQVGAAVDFAVYADDAEEPAWSAGPLGPSDPARSVSLDVTGWQTLTLEATSADGDVDFEHADWLEPTLWLAGSTDTGLDTGRCPGTDTACPADSACPTCSEGGGCGCSGGLAPAGLSLSLAVLGLGLGWRRRSPAGHSTSLPV